MTIPKTIDSILDEAQATNLHRSTIRTEDGTVIITDPDLGVSVSGRTMEEAEAELARRKMKVAA